MAVIGPFGYTGGWNANTGPYDCPQDCYVDAQNVEFIGGRLQKKNGNKLWTDQHPGHTAAAGNYSPIALFQGKLVVAGGAYVAHRSTATSDIVTNWTNITAGTPPKANMWVAELNNILVIGGSDQVPVKWTGTGNVAVLGGSPPANSTCGTMVNNYLFLSGNTSFPWRVYWSAVLDPETWPAANYVDVRKDDNNPVVALFPFGEDLLIFKRNCIARFYTNQLSSSLGPLVVINENLGSMGNGSYTGFINRLPDGRIVFMGNDQHIYIYDGNTFMDITNPPYPKSNILPLLSNLNFAQLTSIAVHTAKNQIWFPIFATYVNPRGTSYFSVTMIYDYSLGVWVCAYPDHAIVSCLAYVVGGTPFIVSMESAGYMCREDFGYSNNDQNGSSTNSFESYVTKSIGIGADEKQFTPRSVMIPVNSASFNGALYYGQNGYNNPPTSFTFSHTGTVVADYKKVFALSSLYGGWNTAQFRFDGALSNQAFNISPFYVSDEFEAQV